MRWTCAGLVLIALALTFGSAAVGFFGPKNDRGSNMDSSVSLATGALLVGALAIVAFFGAAPSFSSPLVGNGQFQVQQ
jgi:hypothetical protein